MDNLPLEQLKIQILKKLRRRKKGATKVIEKLLVQTEQAEGWHSVERQGLVLQANLYQVASGSKRVNLQDWESGNELVIELDPMLSLSDQIKQKIRRSKKLHAAIPHLKDQLQQVQEWSAALDQAMQKVEEAKSVEEVAAIETEFELNPPVKAPAGKPAIKLPYKEYTSSSGMKIWVGKGAKDNDSLTFTYANGSDWWLHVNEYSGSHVVIKTVEGKEPDSITIGDAVQLAIGNSKAAKRGKIEVCVTQVKHVKKFKGAKPGTVHIAKHKNILDEFDKNRYDSILRLLP